MSPRRIALLAGIWAGVLLASPAPRSPGFTLGNPDAAAAAPLFLPGLLAGPQAAGEGVSPWPDAPCAFV